jgi:carbon-monoxide dehydrogenase small subunit
VSQPNDFDQYDFLSADSSGELEIDPLAGSGTHFVANNVPGPRSADQVTCPPMPPASGPFTTLSVRFVLNGEPVEVPEVWVADSLLFVLRDRLGRTAAKDGCGEGECGACVVLVDGEPVLGCLTPALVAEGSAVTTAEAYGDGDEVSAALAAHCGAGCGFCLPGIGLTTRSLLARQPEPSEAAIRESLSGHVCRCLPPGHFVDAVNEAVRRRG